MERLLTSLFFDTFFLVYIFVAFHYLKSETKCLLLLSSPRGQISEAMDIRTRQGLLNALAGKVGKRMDTLLIPLELLCCISRTEFSDKKAYIKWQKRQVSSVPFPCLPEVTDWIRSILVGLLIDVSEYELV